MERWQPDDTRPLTDEKAKTTIYAEWTFEWLANNLTQEQQSGPSSRRASIFAVYSLQWQILPRGLLDSGLVWTPNLKQVQTNMPGASEHFAQRFYEFCGWIQVVLEAIRKHTDDDEMTEARCMSGDIESQHGLTAQETR